jgi:hypothetical protein
MFGLNDKDNKTLDNGGGMPPDSPASAPVNPFDGGPANPPADLPAPPVSGFSADNSLAAPAPLTNPLPMPKPDEPVAASSNDLLDLKGQALSSLQPLVGHLDQSPEEKFKTTMMLIQATDNPSLVKQAYETASQIPDEKARAQALLDVVNEINYFTQRDKGKEEKPKTA